MNIKAADQTQMRQIYELYMEAFPEEERKPFELMQQKVQEGKMEILAIEEEGFAGLAITVLYEDRVLLDYFAIAPECREKGVGSRALQMLKERYKEKCFFLEIELIDEKAINNAERIRRKAFYKRNGMKEVGVRVCLFGVDMELLTAQKPLTFESYFEVYDKIFGGKISRNVTKL